MRHLLLGLYYFHKKTIIDCQSSLNLATRVIHKWVLAEYATVPELNETSSTLRQFRKSSIELPTLNFNIELQHWDSSRRGSCYWGYTCMGTVRMRGCNWEKQNMFNLLSSTLKQLRQLKTQLLQIGSHTNGKVLQLLLFLLCYVLFPYLHIA